MANLTLAEVRNGKAIPQRSDTVGNLRYMGSGDPSDLANYRPVGQEGGSSFLTGSIFDFDGTVPEGDGNELGGSTTDNSSSPFGSQYLRDMNDRISKSAFDASNAQVRASTSRMPLVNGRMPPGGNYNL